MERESTESFGELLRTHRMAAGHTQEVLAERAGISVRSIQRLERGESHPIKDTARRLAAALDLEERAQAYLLAAAIPTPRRRQVAQRSPTVPPAEAQSTESPYAPRDNLPAALSSFIGRERELTRVGDLLGAHRLVTLTGSGGVGKTRLALAVAGRKRDVHPDGVRLVELAPLADPALVAGAVAQVLGLHEEVGRPLLTTLTDHLRDRRLLLVLDNGEHLLAACADLAAALLRACPHLHLLVTSREGLGVAGERRYRVPPLSTPDPKHLPPPDLAGSYEAVRLFVERARERREDFMLTPTNARAVAEICARLDGVPLAVELAAARVEGLSVEAIAARLDDRFKLLTGGARDLPTRQRTLRAALDWSWDLLDEEGRTLLARLSVFAGGWALEAAEVVCAGDGLESWAVLDGLVVKSLVQVDEAEGKSRYQLLETVRQYAGEQLAAAGEEAPTRDRHLSYFLALAEQAVKAFRGPELGIWLDRLETEHDNLRAALNWARVRERGEEGLQLAAALAPFWEFRGHIAEGRRRVEEMLAAFQGSPRVRARALNAAGFLGLRGGEPWKALALYQESLALRRDLNDLLGMAVSLSNIGSAHVELGRYEQAEPAYAEALEFYRALGDQSGIATAFNNQAVATRELGQYERAEALAQESLALRRAQGDLRGVAEATNNLAQVASVQGRYERATALFREGLLLSRAVGDMIRLLEALEGLAWAGAALGQPGWAARQGGAAEAERERLGLPQGIPDRSFRERAISAMHAALGAQMFAAAWSEGRDVMLSEAIALALKADPTG